MQKEKSEKSKAKHFTQLERKLFLDILKKYKHVIEVKKSDGATLKDKDVAWSEICNEYNLSHLISQERTVQQLKKFWTNLKQNQRDALTREKQARMATGGGPSIISVEIDPDISTIAPNLMKTAPAIYSSNFDEEETEKRKTQIMDDIPNDINIEFLKDDTIIDCESIQEQIICNSSNLTSDKENIMPDTSKKEETSVKVHSQKSLQLTQISTDDSISIVQDFSNKDSQKPKENKENSPFLKRRKHAILAKDESENEATLRIERIQKILTQEMEINNIKIEHEKNVSVLKEQHLIKLQEQELRAATATAKAAELQLELQYKKNDKFFNS